MMKPLSTILMAAMLIAVAIVPRGEAKTCTQIKEYVQVCVPYVMDKGPIGKCCDGIKTLAGVVKDTIDRQHACQCLLGLGENFPGINIGKVSGLPKECGVDAPYIVIDSKTDCSKIK